MTARDHNKLLAIFYFIQAGLQVIGGFFVAILYSAIGGVALSSARRDDEQIVGGIFIGVGIVVAVIMLVFGAFALLTAFKVLKEKPVGRTLGIILSILILLSFPLGTALGIYGLWFFFGEVGKNYYAGLSSSPAPPPPPSPAGWR